MTWYYRYKTLQTYSKKFLDLINELSKVAVYRIIMQKSLAFLYTNIQFKNTIPFTNTSKRKKISMNKLFQGGETCILKNIRHYWKILNTQIHGKKFQPCELEALILLKFSCYPKQSTISMQFLSNSNGIFHRNKTKSTKISIGPLKTMNFQINLVKEEQS